MGERARALRESEESKVMRRFGVLAQMGLMRPMGLMGFSSH
jgi:hypothetical protein